MTDLDDFKQTFHQLTEGGAKQGQSGEQPGIDWAEPDWSILDDRRGVLPDFPIQVLSTECADWVARAAQGAGVTVDHVAIPLLGIASSLLGTVRRAKASRSWSEPMTLWTAIVGSSGTGKTPGINATKRALAQVEKNRKAKIAELQRQHDAKIETAKVARDRWKEELKQAAEGEVVSFDHYREVAQKLAMPPEAVDPGPFVAPRLYVSNITVEKLAVLLTARPQGLLLLADELAGLFLNMSRYSGGQDHEFWLEAWCGGQYRVERMNRPAVDLDHLLVGLVGGLQPDKLARSFHGDLDGMYARVLFAWPAEPTYRLLTDEVSEIEPEIINALTRIVDLEGCAGDEGEFAPRAISLSSEAVEEFERLRQFVHHHRQGLDGRERDWIAKVPAHVLRLAGTLAILAWAMKPGAPEPTEISVEFTKSAIDLVRNYFLPHSRAALRQIGLSERHADARRVLLWIKAHKPEAISVMAVRRDALAQSLDKEQTVALFGSLERGGWIREITRKSGSRGQPARRWAVNPAVYAANAENAGNRPQM